MQQRAAHDVILAAIAEERARVSSRRSLMRGGAKLAAGTALALAATPALGQLRAMAQAFEGPVDVLNYALTLEHLEYAFYRDGLDQFSTDQFEDGVYDRLTEIRDHEGAHVNTLTQVVGDLGGEPVEEAEYDFGYGDDPDAFLEVAAALENTGVSAYDGAGAALIENDDLLTAAGTIVAVEARHASYLNLIIGEVPFPAAFETPLSRAEVLEIAGPFIVS